MFKDKDALSLLLGSLRDLCEQDGRRAIEWQQPDLANEIGEYFENEYTLKAFSAHGVRFEDTPEGQKELLAFLSRGRMVRLSPDDIERAGFDNMTLGWKHFKKELAAAEYASSFGSMKRSMRKGGLRLPSPILIQWPDGTYYGFAGNRRSNLAWSHKVPVTFWVVQAPQARGRDRKPPR